jgi:Protein of unknown function (DUF3667)
MEQSPTICKNCQNTFTGKYCNHCGEKLYTEHDRTFIHMVEEAMHFITHLDGTLIHTIKAIFTRPGQLSVDYCAGKRKTYFKPLSFFLLLVVLYLLFPYFQGLNMKLYFHVRHYVYGNFAMQKTLALMKAKHFSDAQMGAAYDAKSEKVSKFLLLVLLPLTALFTWMLSYKRRPLFFDQMVFSAEINSFYLLWGFLVLPLVLKLFLLVYRLFAPVHFDSLDALLGAIIFIGYGLFLVNASRRFYGYRTGRAILFSLLTLVGSFIIIDIIYKFLLFFITISLIH